MIIAEKIEKYYGDLHVLKGIDLHVEKSEVVSIVGASGAGKTTLLQILGTLDKSDNGKLAICGKDLKKMSEKELSVFRNQEIGFIFQFHHLLPEFTALENVLMPALIAGKSKKAMEKEAWQLLERMGIEERAKHKPSELSGGEQQRVAVARALINKPSIILADEPSGNLDSENATQLHHLFFELRKEFGQTFVIVTHNEHLAEMSDRKITMKDGFIQ